jgi:hypothetical protein
VVSEESLHNTMVLNFKLLNSAGHTAARSRRSPCPATVSARGNLHAQGGLDYLSVTDMTETPKPAAILYP